MNRTRLLLVVALTFAAGITGWLTRGGLSAQEKPVPAAPAARWEYKVADGLELYKLADPNFKLEQLEPAAWLDYGKNQNGLNKLGEDGGALIAVPTESGASH